MPAKKLNAQVLWMQFEDVLAPGLRLTVKERAVYCYLLRHSLVAASRAYSLRLRRWAVLCIGHRSGAQCGCAGSTSLGALRVLRRTRTVIPWRCGRRRRSARSAGAGNGAPFVAQAGAGVVRAARAASAATLETKDFWKNLGAPQSHSRSRTRHLLLLPSPRSR